MNERVMQFRIGMFVIVAGTGPDHADRLVRRISRRCSATRFSSRSAMPKRRRARGGGRAEERHPGGEVAAIQFDHRPNQPDGVLVTMAIEHKYSIREGQCHGFRGP